MPLKCSTRGGGGVLRPHVIEDKCINCGRCVKTCPAAKPKPIIEPKFTLDNNFTFQKISTPEMPLACYAAWADDETRMHSSSGGMFPVLAKYVLDRGGRVFGAVWTKDFFCNIKQAKSWEEILPMRYSKYVQSNTQKTFREVKELLSKNILVAYFGLPCQIAGLKAYLAGDTQGLITVDLVCFCSPSNVHFRKYLHEEFGIDKVKNVTFREKSSPTKWAPTSYLIDFKDSASLYPKGNADPYQRAFHGVLARNDTCNDCRYYRFPRQGDFTLGDFWGVPAHWNDRKGTSVVLTNTNLAEEIMAQLKFQRCEKVPLDWCMGKGNRIGKEARPSNPRRFYFRELVKHFSFRKAVDWALTNHHDIGLAAWLNPNLGNNLTNYALWQYLTDSGYKVLLIGNPVAKPQSQAMYVRGGDERLGNFLKNPFPDYAVLAPKVNYSALQEVNTLCEKFIIGSDQVWRGLFLKGLKNFPLLDWVNSDKYKIAYASSFGIEIFAEDEKLRENVGKCLSRFQSISVREDSGVDILKNVFGLRGEHVLDPVFLMDMKYYDEMAFNGRIRLPDSSYVGAYFLDPTNEKATALKSAANKFSSDVYHALGEKVPKGVNLTLLSNPKPAIEEWLAMVKYSEYFLTDSFHGTCLAIIFKRQFVIIYDKKNWRGWTRFASIVKLLGLEDRVVDPAHLEKFDEVLSTPIDWDAVYKKLEIEREHSKTWLLESLEMSKYFRGCAETSSGNIFENFPSDSSWLYQVQNLNRISNFEIYVNILFNCRNDLIIFVASRDTHTTGKSTSKKLNLMKMLNISTDLEKTFRYSWSAVIDGERVIDELADKSAKVVSKYSWDKHSAEVSSEGYHSPESPGNCSIKIDGKEYSVSKRGLNFVVWSKAEQKVIDSVCFDTFDNVSFERKTL